MPIPDFAAMITGGTVTMPTTTTDQQGAGFWGTMDHIEEFVSDFKLPSVKTDVTLSVEKKQGNILLIAGAALLAFLIFKK